MKSISLGIICSIFLLTSCVDQKALDLAQVQHMASAIETNMNANRAYELGQMFSPTRYAMRLGSDFYDLPKMERQYAYAAFRGFYENIINSYLDAIDEENLQFNLFDIHEKDGVYRLNFILQSPTEIDHSNFIVFYAAFDKDEELKVVNLYNVFQGFSLSQMGTEILNDMSNKSTSFEMRRYEAQRDITRAMEIAETGDFEFAHHTLDIMDRGFVKKSGVAYLKPFYASQFSDSLYRKELEWIKTISPNDQSKLFYDCAIKSLDKRPEQEMIDCTDALVALLKKS